MKATTLLHQLKNSSSKEARNLSSTLINLSRRNCSVCKTDKDVSVSNNLRVPSFSESGRSFIHTSSEQLVESEHEILQRYNKIHVAQSISRSNNLAYRNKYGVKKQAVAKNLNFEQLTSKKANIIISQMTHDYELGKIPERIIETSMLVIDHYVKTKLVHKAATTLLMLIDERQAGNLSVEFNVDSTVNLVLNTARKFDNSGNFCNFALNLLTSMENLKKHDSSLPKAMAPNLKTYNMVMDILSKSGRKNAVSEIQDILDTMNQSDRLSVVPDLISYNCLLYAYSQRTDSKAAKECETLFRWMKASMEIDTISYNILMDAWSKNNDNYAAQRAEALLREMQEDYKEGIQRVKPNFISFTTVINAWANSKDLDAPSAAEDILQLMEDLDQSGEVGVSPNIITLNSVLNAWARSSQPQSAQRAEMLLSNMIESYQKGRTSVIPDKISFSICINSWANSEVKGASNNALNLLKTMQKLHKLEDFDTMPDTISLNTALRSLANDSDEHKATKAEGVLHEMENLHLKPNLQTYNNILRCCCTTRSEAIEVKRNAVRIATQMLLNLHRSKEISPDPFTFNFFIKVCDRLSNGREKVELIKSAFNFCIETGQFSPPVLSILKNSLSPVSLKEVLRINDDRLLKNLEVSNFPADWSSRWKTQTSNGNSRIDLSQGAKRRSTLRQNRMKI